MSNNPLLLNSLFSSRGTALIATALFSAFALLFAGCLTQHQLIERRAGEKASFFTTLTPENQQRIRNGNVQAGDSPDAVWIVYGRPDRVFQKITATSTNDVWSYVAQEIALSDEQHLSPVYHPLYSQNGKAIWQTDYVWSTDNRFETHEYLRIEFQNNRVLTIETEHP